MGDRANVKFIYTYPRDEENPKYIHFYTHWGGFYLPPTVAAALDRGRSRWDDDSYLARIIFSEMIKDEVLEEAGYGISPEPPDNEHPIIEVDSRTQTVNGITFDKFIEDPYKPFGGIDSW